MTIDEAITQALASPHGVSLSLADARAAIRFRADFYALRERRRRQGDTSWDDVAVSIPQDARAEIRIIKKSSTPSVQASRRHAIGSAKPLALSDLPRALRSRGRGGQHSIIGRLYDQTFARKV